ALHRTCFHETPAYANETFCKNATNLEVLDRLELELNFLIQLPISWLIFNQGSSLDTKVGELNLTYFLPEEVQLNNSVTRQMAESESNIAATYWEHWLGINWRYRKNMKPGVTYCETVNLTDPLHLKHLNLYWQMLFAVPEYNPSKSILMYMYSAYYDDRIKSNP